MIKLFALALALPLCAASLRAETLTCQFAVPASARYITTSLVITIDPAAGEVSIEDPSLKDYVSAPLQGHIQTSNAARRTLVWQTPMMQQPGWLRPNFLQYILTIMKGSDAASVYVKPSSGWVFVQTYEADTNGRAEGHCHAKG